MWKTKLINTPDLSYTSPAVKGGERNIITILLQSSPVTDVVFVAYLSDCLDVAWQLKARHIHDPDELTLVSVDHDSLVVPVQDEDVALVIGDDTRRLGNVSWNIPVCGVHNLDSSH